MKGGKNTKYIIIIIMINNSQVSEMNGIKEEMSGKERQQPQTTTTINKQTTKRIELN